MEELGVKGKNTGLGKKVLEDKNSLRLCISPPNSILLAINKLPQGRSVLLGWWLVSELPVFIPTYKYCHFLPLPRPVGEGGVREGLGGGSSTPNPSFGF